MTQLTEQDKVLMLSKLEEELLHIMGEEVENKKEP
jgi:hypothetical protein